MKNDKRISSLTAIDTRTGDFYKYRARIFIDCSGDGWPAYYAGAKYRIGREAGHEYNESMAPLLADNKTMSGCLMGGGLTFQSEDTDIPVEFTPPPGFQNYQQVIILVVISTL